MRETGRQNREERRKRDGGARDLDGLVRVEAQDQSLGKMVSGVTTTLANKTWTAEPGNRVRQGSTDLKNPAHKEV